MSERVRFSDVIARLAAGVGPVYPAAHLVVVDGGAAVLDVAVGDAVVPANAPPAIFDVASLTKALVTTTLAMRAVDAGRLSLDDELREGGILVRHALAHATGLPAWRPLYAAVQQEPPAARRRAAVAHARAVPGEAAPGARSVYSDLGMILLGDRLEQVAGDVTLDEQWRSLAAALGLAGEAMFRPAPSPRLVPTAAPLAPGEVHDDNARAMDGVAGHAGLFATAPAVAAVAAHLVARWHGDPPVDGAAPLALPATVRAFWSPSGVPGSTWCLGWDRPSPGAGSQAGDRWPRDGVGHLGFTGCSLWIDPPRRRFVVLLSNRTFPVAGSDRSRYSEAIKQLRPALHDAIVSALDGA